MKRYPLYHPQIQSFLLTCQLMPRPCSSSTQLCRRSTKPMKVKTLTRITISHYYKALGLIILYFWIHYSLFYIPKFSFLRILDLLPCGSGFTIIQILSFLWSISNSLFCLNQLFLLLYCQHLLYYGTNYLFYYPNLLLVGPNSLIYGPN